MRIRRANVSDFSEIIACEQLAFDRPVDAAGAGAVGRSKLLASHLRTGEIHVIGVARMILGYISFAPGHDHLFVDTLAVVPSHHRKGLGSVLLNHAEATASEMGLGSVKLFTDGRISRNMKFYRHRGYRETGRCEDIDFSRVYYSKAVAA